MADELFAKALQNLQSCVLANNNWYRELVSSLETPTTFDQCFKVTWVPFFIPEFRFYNTLTVPCERFKTFSFTSSMIVNIVVFPSWSRFPVKLICCIAFESVSSACFFT